jgi:hypothetical protein
VKNADEYLENLFLLTSNRKRGNIFLLTSNAMRIVTMMDNGFCAIPITQFQSFMQNDFQLNLVENYLLKLKYAKDMKIKNMKDFGYLTHSALNKKKSNLCDSMIGKDGSRDHSQSKSYNMQIASNNNSKDSSNIKKD